MVRVRIKEALKIVDRDKIYVPWKKKVQFVVILRRRGLFYVKMERYYNILRTMKNCRARLTENEQTC